ncbi:hypothetical protein QBC32DRAFT_150204 [Pseudoneurospora amorphoporcata]|uniref:Secreted protein n=1 Tax=Pseudoneurospora amorphoporcata TaxID=241081 RepID=A0AAN6SFX7_9PEZI|nr:hypothetical protein QBC32DRAFT_150204 [Pseudoneurospora amorphoporcata]
MFSPCRFKVRMLSMSLSGLVCPARLWACFLRPRVHNTWERDYKMKKSIRQRKKRTEVREEVGRPIRLSSRTLQSPSIIASPQSPKSNPKLPSWQTGFRRISSSPHPSCSRLKRWGKKGYQPKRNPVIHDLFVRPLVS